MFPYPRDMLRRTIATVYGRAMTNFSGLPPIYLARHAETVFNRAARMQGWQAHSPLTVTGFEQAQAMGSALKGALGDTVPALWCSSAGRTRQTLAIVCDVMGLDYMAATPDDRLQEIDVGLWEGRYYADIMAEVGPIIDLERRLFSKVPPEGEWYDSIEERMMSWLADIKGTTTPVLVISHGISARVLRGLLVGGEAYFGVAIAPDAPQGTVFRIENGQEEAIHVGAGFNAERLRSV
jgi:broad specificity phosphatase PhoE